MIISFLKPIFLLLITVISDNQVRLVPNRALNHIKFEIADKEWQSENNENPYGPIAPVYALIHGNSISIYAENKSSTICEKIILQFNSEKISNSSVASQESYSITLKRNGTYYSLKKDETAYVDITNWDVKKRIIGGVFSFSVSNLNRENLTISKGEFYIKY